MTGKHPVVGNLRAGLSIDDLALSFISAFNLVNFNYNEGVYRTKATACIFVKSKTTKPNCPPPTHVFSGLDWDVSRYYFQSKELHSYIWFKEFPVTETINRMRQIIAREGLDYLYKQIHGNGYPIVAARVVLFDWTSNYPVSNLELNNDPCYSNKGFFNQTITKFAMNQLRLPYGVNDPLDHQTIRYLYNNDNRMDISKLDSSGLNQLLRDYQINIKSIVSEVFEKTHFYLKYRFAAQPQQFVELNNKLSLYVIDPQFTPNVINCALYNLQNNKAWRSRFINTDNHHEMIKNLIYFMLNNYLDSLILT